MIAASSTAAGQDGWIHSFQLSQIDGAGRGSATVTVIGSSPRCFSQEITGEFTDGVLDLMLFEKVPGVCHLDLRFEPLTFDFQIGELPALIQATRVFTDNGTSGGNVAATEGPYPLREFTEYIPGDSNLDGLFDSTDLVSVFAAGEYDDEIAGNSTWFSGDWDGDSEFDSSDLVMGFQGGYELPREAAAIMEAVRTDTASVPEPSSLVLFVIASVAFFCQRPRRTIV
jgi:hypothetical protein